jgi:metal-dependent amidase/aminoacylase/carboxypeptidase family protein
MAVGAEVEIRNLPGYLPVLNTPSLDNLFAANMGALLGPDAIGRSPHLTGSSDMGDITHLMPGLHPMIKAGSAKVHTEKFCIEDTRLAYLETAKGLAMTAIDLLYDGAREGLTIKSAHKPTYNKEQFLKFWESLCQEA